MTMGTPDGIGWIALFCLTLVPAALLVLFAGSAVKAFRAGDKKTALFDTIAFFCAVFHDCSRCSDYLFRINNMPEVQK